jgi:glutamate dehydrogenase
MTATESKHSGGQPERAALLEDVIARVPDRRDLVEVLAAATYRRAPAAALRRVEEDPGTAAARLAEALAFIEARNGDGIALRVFEPSPEQHGWAAPGTVVEVCIEDGPFLVTTVEEELRRLGYEITELLHPVVGVERDGDGRLRRLTRARSARQRESLIQAVLDRHVPAGELRDLDGALRAVLTDARAVTRDFAQMRARVAETIERVREEAGARYGPEEVEETAALLRWLLEDHFVFLGARRYRLEDDPVPSAVVDAGSGLGVLADEASSGYARPVPLAEVPSELRARMEGGDLLTVARTNRRSTVHRQARMVYVGIKRVDADGQIVGEDRVLGLFAQKAYAEPASTIPILRRKLAAILSHEDVVEHSHDERTLRSLFDAFPKHELFAASPEDLRAVLVPLLETAAEADVRLLHRVDPTRRGVSILVSVPRDRFTGAIRKRVQDLLADRFQSSTIDYHLSMTDGGRALLHFLLHVDPSRLDEVAFDQLELDVVALTRTWEDGLRRALVDAHGEIDGQTLAERWANRFPASYQATADPRAAVEDLDDLTRLVDDEAASRLRLHPGRDAGTPLRFVLVKTGPGIELSASCPSWRASGSSSSRRSRTSSRRWAPTARPARCASTTSACAWPAGRTSTSSVTDHGSPRLRRRSGGAGRGRLPQPARAARRPRLGGRRRPAGLPPLPPPGRDLVHRGLPERGARRAPGGRPRARRLFRAPSSTPTPTTGAARSRRARGGRRALEEVQRLDQDRILRGYLGMIEATLRTNRYVERTDDGQPALRSSSTAPRCPRCPSPSRTSRSSSTAPSHRGRPPARRAGRPRRDPLERPPGGRPHRGARAHEGPDGQERRHRADRGEGRVRAQGRRRPGPELAARSEGSTRTYIRALLDVTDNVVGGEVRPPGACAARRRRPLPRRRGRPGDGDVLRPGERDQRGVRLLARRRVRLRRLAGLRPQGDGHHRPRRLGGGPAPLPRARGRRADRADRRRRHRRHVRGRVRQRDAAQPCRPARRGVRPPRHLHRPRPRPERSFEERERLFELPGSSWQDYDRSLLSEGGGVWSRTVKEIPLSPRRAGCCASTRAAEPAGAHPGAPARPVDLLFAGGIGTFVKASARRTPTSGDRANDAIRIDATELGARVVGEGGNLALTQRAASSTPGAAGAATPTPSTTSPAWTPPTAR